MKKLGILLGVGLLFTMMIGYLKAHADYERAQESIVTHDGNIEPLR